MLKKLSNSKGFTIMEVICAVAILAMGMTCALYSITAVNQINSTNSAIAKEAYDYTAEFENYVSGGTNIADVLNLSDVDIVTTTVSCYSTFGVLNTSPDETNIAYTNFEYLLYTDPSGNPTVASNPSRETFLLTIHTYYKDTTDRPVNAPYYFVVE